jgi:plasmid segregation protein ParM
LKLAAIDLGFMYGKAIINNKPLKIKSVVGTPIKLRFEDLRMGKSEQDRIQVKYHGNHYFVSDLAITQSPTIDFSLKADRFNSIATAVIADALFATGLGEGSHDIFVVSGLPVSHYDKYKDAITELFMGSTLPDSQKEHSYSVIVDGEQINGKFRTMQGKFIPQPFGVLVDQILNEDGSWKNKGLAKKTVAIVDVGFGTSDIYTTNSLDTIESLTFSTQTAMNQAYSLIAMKIEEDIGVQLKLHQIEPIVRSGKFRKNGKVYNIQNIIQWACESTAHQLVSEIGNKWKDNAWQIDHIIVAGGGGEMLYPYLEEHFSSIQLAEDSQMSVVKGYHKWGMKLWRDRLVTTLHV